MRASKRTALLSLALVPVLTGIGLAQGKNGFADKPGGGFNDPIIEVYGSVGPNQGARMSRTAEEANAAYKFNAMGTSGAPEFELTSTPPTIPMDANGANQFIRIKFPFKISSNKVQKTIMKPKAPLAGTSFLTPKISITDEMGIHVPGIATINGRTVHGTKVSNDPFFPVWLNAKGKNQLVGKNVFTYVADDGDQQLSTISAFGPTPGDEETSQIKEVRIRIGEVDKITINGFWVLKIGDANGVPVPGQNPVTLDDVVALSPVTPPKTNNGNEVVETFSKYVMRFSEPVVPWSVGFGASAVQQFNAGNPEFPLHYNGNSGPVPNIDPAAFIAPFFPNVRVNASPNGISTFVVPFDVRPVNPNNLSEYQLNPILDLPGSVTVTITGLPFSQNGNTAPNGTVISSAVTSLHNTHLDQLQGNSFTFFTNKGRAFVNVPVSPSAVYYAPISGSGAGLINLDGNGFETNDPAVNRLIILTNSQQMCACPVFPPFFAGSHTTGCNPNTFGDPTATNPIGIAGNTDHLGPPTPLPGINEGSAGSTANGGNPFGKFPEGFETVSRTSTGNPRLADAPAVGGISDLDVGEFLDTLFYDVQNPFAATNLHQSLAVGGSVNRNTISDPPVPNPPPLRLPVGLPPVDVVFNQQKLLKPAFVIEGDEVWTQCVGCPGTCLGTERILLRPNPINPQLGDVFPTFPQNGPVWQTFVPIGPGPNPVGLPYGARQQIGNFLYLADRDNGGVSVLNSNTFSVIDRIGTPDPESTAVAPDLKRLYVTNYGTNDVSVIDIDPFSGNFHTEIERVKVGAGPRSVSVQPDNEDVFVCNYIGDSVSIIDVKTMTVRRTLTGSLKRPWQVILAPRQVGIFPAFGTGFINLIYMGYIASQGTGDITVYESGPSGATGFGGDDLRWTVQTPDGSIFDEVRGMCYDPGTYPGSTTNLPGGIYVTHRDSETGFAMVSRVSFTAQIPQGGPLPPVALPGSILISPGVVQRTFSVVGFWGGPLLPFAQQINPGGADQSPFDIALADMTCSSFHDTIVQFGYKTNIGAFPITPNATLGQVIGGIAGSVNSKHPHRMTPNPPTWFPTWVPDRMYVSFPSSNRIVVLDPNAGGQILNTIDGVPSAGALSTFFDQ